MWVKVRIEYNEALDLASRLRSRMTIPAMNGCCERTDPVLKMFVERLEEMIGLYRLDPDFGETLPENALSSMSIKID